MKILIISPGKRHDAMVAEGIAEFEKRLEKKSGIEWSFPTAGTKEEEGAAILKQLKDGDYCVLLDERGKDIDTPGVAKLLDTHLQQGTKRLVFIIGGAFGVDGAVQARANVTYKLSSLIFPHMLVRLILVEQLYRANSILEGGKYHHA
jgi:23S rRNA (pseudouridine1915-N3)-methyltransferase